MQPHIHNANHPKPGCSDCEVVLDRAIKFTEEEVDRARKDLYAATRMIEVALAERDREEIRLGIASTRLETLTQLHANVFAPPTLIPQEVSA